MKTTMNDFNMENMTLQEKIQTIFKFHNGLAIQERLQESKGTEVNYNPSDTGYTFSTETSVLKINDFGSVESNEIEADETIIQETKSRILKTETMLNMIWN